MSEVSNPSRDSLLTTALVGALLPADVPEGRMIRTWLDSWGGIGHVVDAMHALGYDARLCQSPFGWRVEFCRDQVHALPRWIGTGVDVTPWRSIQRAALDTLRRDQKR